MCVDLKVCADVSSLPGEQWMPIRLLIRDKHIDTGIRMLNWPILGPEHEEHVTSSNQQCSPQRPIMELHVACMFVCARACACARLCVCVCNKQMGQFLAPRKRGLGKATCSSGYKVHRHFFFLNRCRPQKSDRWLSAAYGTSTWTLCLTGCWLPYTR